MSVQSRLQRLSPLTRRRNLRSDESYHTLKAALLERIRDKEASVRQHAVVALSKLQDADEGAGDSEDDSEDEDEGKEKKSVTEVLIGVLNHDPAA